jgi:flavin-dependent dehydrogenase
MVVCSRKTNPGFQVKQFLSRLKPFCSMVHRAEYHETLYEEALRLGAEVRFDFEVQQLCFEDEASVTTVGGKVIKGDVVVGADGVAL